MAKGRLVLLGDMCRWHTLNSFIHIVRKGPQSPTGDAAYILDNQSHVRKPFPQILSLNAATYNEVQRSFASFAWAFTSELAKQSSTVTAVQFPTESSSQQWIGATSATGMGV